MAHNIICSLLQYTSILKQAMPRVSSNVINETVKKEIGALLTERLVLLDSRAKAARFLRHFLTPEEETMLSKRLATVILVKRGIHYRRISRLLKISFATINTMHRHIERGEYNDAVLEGLALKRGSQLETIIKSLSPSESERKSS